MRLVIVRHAIALRQADWREPDHLRPLTPKGYEQAELLVDVLGGVDVNRVFSSPFLRCVETITPLAARRALPVEPLDELTENRRIAVLARLRDVDDDSVVLCSHGDVIPDLLDALLGSKGREDGEWRCAKGSTWIVDGWPGDAPTARYLPAPA
jgi:broad specificity phosphatase PhoE